MNLSRPGLAFLLIFTLFHSPFAFSSAKKRGAAVFADNGCQHCHTIRGQGGAKGPDLSGVGRTLNKDQIRTQILQGGRQMPPFADVLKKAETDDLVAYLHSCRDKKPK